MFDMAKQKRRCFLLIIIFTILFLIFGYLNYLITYPLFLYAEGFEPTGFVLFSGLAGGILWFVVICFAGFLFVPDVIFLILILVNIYNYYKYSKMEKEHQR